ncbi:hypothetical protein J7355_15585 [Endozoicomonas sp. G2_2]|uniref:hypothetical protein n=1 Tax=Endozoicomonas sp. G2_2 TaxID=2821092 RepID=UPI001AD99715|nr:hypothetical protein [Endozoicomonas sp. G2_2]MBO9471511.1 hypothetical protein [Endozoicomonas sp. G2_2]
MPNNQSNEFPYAPMLPVAGLVIDQHRWMVVIATLTQDGTPILRLHDSLQDQPRMVRVVSWAEIAFHGDHLLQGFFQYPAAISNGKVYGELCWSCKDVQKTFSLCHEQASRLPMVEVIRQRRDQPQAIEIVTVAATRSTSVMYRRRSFHYAPGRQLCEREDLPRSSVSGEFARRILKQAKSDERSIIPSRQGENILAVLPRRVRIDPAVMDGPGPLAF